MPTNYIHISTVPSFMHIYNCPLIQLCIYPSINPCIHLSRFPPLKNYDVVDVSIEKSYLIFEEMNVYF